jgi:hypothetical protein
MTVDNSSGNKRTTVINSNYHGPPIGKVEQAFGSSALHGGGKRRLYRLIPDHFALQIFSRMAS